MWTLSLCPIGDYVWHNPCCLKVECLNCGVDMFMTCPTQKNKHLALCMYSKCYELVIHDTR
jgi:hypothetical protein